MLNIIEIEINFNLNIFNIIFSIVVLIIRSLVYLYRKFYFHFTIKFNYKINLIIFIFSIIILINRNNFILLLIGWDGLGISSFFLVSYYFNRNRLISGLITFFFNRLGDSFIIIFCSLIISITFKIILYKIKLIIVIIIFIGLITKRSQIPFGVWLPIAISAPTPISSLVHSSTLVTAGIFVLIKFNYIFFIYEIQHLIIIFRLITFFFAGIFAISILDFKKAIAFSTLSQIGLILFSLRTGNILISFYHLIFHAFFKSSLFVNLGLFIIFNFSIQDYRFLKRFSINKIFKISFLISRINLIGLIFSSGFISKDFILIYFFNEFPKILINLIFFLRCIFTVSYTLKFNIFFFLEKIKILKFNFLFKFNIYFFKIILFFIFIIIIPIIFINLIIIDFYFILDNYKYIFYLIIIFSLIILKFFNFFNFIIFLFSSILFILDFISYTIIKLMIFLKIIIKLNFLEEFIQLNLIYFNFNNIKFKFNIINSINLFLFSIILIIYLPNQ